MKRKKLVLTSLMFLSLLIGVSSLVSCNFIIDFFNNLTDNTDSIEYTSEFMNTYGYGNAYTMFPFDGLEGSYYSHAPSEVAYYIDSSVTDEYLEAVEYALEKANELTDAVTITTTDDPNSDFVIKVEDLGIYGGGAGVNELQAFASVRINNGTTTVLDVYFGTSTITLNSFHMNWYSLSYKKFVALHEIGHTFGLADLYDTSNPAKDVSIMGASYKYDDYTEFDRLNIDWLYDDLV